VYTVQGKPVWVKLSLPGNASGVELEPGQSLQMTLAYWFDINDHPLPGDSLVLNFDLNTFPLGQFTVPSNNHTQGNQFRNGQLTLHFADVGGFQFITATQGTININFYVSGSATPGEYEPVVTGTGSTDNVFTIDPEITVRPTQPGPPSGGGDSYHRILKYSEHALVGEEGSLIYVPAYSSLLNETPKYIAYELTINYGYGNLWVQEHQEYDYVAITDTLGPGQIFAEEGTPVFDNGGNLHFNGNYNGINPFFSIIGIHYDPVTGTNAYLNALDASSGVTIEISQDRKNLTITISKDTFFSDHTRQLGNSGGLALYFYVKVTDPDLTRYTDNAQVLFIKNGAATSGESDHTIRVTGGGSAHFIIKQVGKTLETMGDYSNENPLVLQGESLVYYRIAYTVTGTDAAPGSINILDELPAQLSGAQIINGWTSGGTWSVSIDNTSLNSRGGHSTITATNIGPVAAGTTIYLVFSANVQNLTPGEPVKNVIQGTDASVIKKDGFVLNLFKRSDDESSVPLSGASFTLYRQEGSGYVLYSGEPDAPFANPLTTNGFGYTGMAPLPPGEYRLVETSAPAGYQLDSVPIDFRIWPNGEGQGIEIISANNNVPDPVITTDGDSYYATIIVPDTAMQETLPVDVNFSAFKQASGAPLPAGRFDFGVFNQDGSLIAVASSDAAGNVSFPSVSITQAGTYQYTIRELSLSGGGWTVDDANFPVTVTAVDNGAGQLVASVNYPAGTPGFNNVYSAPSTSEQVVAYKELAGWSGAEAPFTFGLFDQSGNLLETAQNINGLVTFSQLPYSSPGVYNYTIKELTPSGNGWITDSNVYPATITVTGDSAGHLIALASYPQGQPVFRDVYNAEPIFVSLVASKSALGAALPSGQFTFSVIDENGNTVANAVNEANGNVVFPELTFSQSGIYSYTVRESSPGLDGWTGDSATYIVTVTVTDDGMGRLVASIGYPQGTPRFVNTYNPPPSPPPAPADVTISAAKRLCGACLFADEFTFAIFGENNSEVARALNSADGSVTFPAITFTQSGIYRFTVRELNASCGFWRMDSRSYPVIVAVTDNGNNDLVARVDYPEGTPSFLNSYCPPKHCSCYHRCHA
jgi:pilin isopeptide linkage protein